MSWPDSCSISEQIDRVRLEGSDVGVGIEGMDAAGGMPARPRCEDAPLDDGYVAPTQFRQVVENAGADHSTADHHYSVLRLQILLRKPRANLTRDGHSGTGQGAPFGPAAFDVIGQGSGNSTIDWRCLEAGQNLLPDTVGPFC